MAGPRIGRADLRAAHERPGGPVRYGPRPEVPPTSLGVVATRATEIGNSLALLTKLLPTVGRRVRHAELERRARVDRLHEQAVAMWYELAKLADEAQAR